MGPSPVWGQVLTAPRVLILPPEIGAEAIRYHHTPSELEEPDDNVDAIHLANVICMILGIGLGIDGLCHRADPGVMTRHGLSEPDLELIGATAWVEFRKMESTMHPASAKTQHATSGETTG